MKNVIEIPAREDWGDFTGDFDVADAYQSFFGRSNSDMQRYFVQDFMMRAQDIRFMPSRPFMYYILGFTDFLLNGSYEGEEADVGNCYLDIVESRMHADIAVLVPVADTVPMGLKFIADNPERFGGYPEIYGEFSGRLSRIEKIILGLSEAMGKDYGDTG